MVVVNCCWHKIVDTYRNNQIKLSISPLYLSALTWLLQYLYKANELTLFPPSNNIDGWPPSSLHNSDQWNSLDIRNSQILEADLKSFQRRSQNLHKSSYQLRRQRKSLKRRCHGNHPLILIYWTTCVKFRIVLLQSRPLKIKSQNWLGAVSSYFTSERRIWLNNLSFWVWTTWTGLKITASRQFKKIQKETNSENSVWWCSENSVWWWLSNKVENLKSHTLALINILNFKMSLFFGICFFLGLKIVRHYKKPSIVQTRTTAAYCRILLSSGILPLERVSLNQPRLTVISLCIF
jgi:hypothetical protein